MDLLLDHCSSDDDYCEDTEDFLKIKCLFCDDVASSHESIIEHISKVHGIDLIEQCKFHGLDNYQFIKLVNYIRKFNCDVSSLKDLLKNKPFDMDDYYKPSLGDDHFLMLDYEDEYVNSFVPVDSSNVQMNDTNNLYENSSKESLIKTIVNLTEQLKESEICLEKMRNLLVDINENNNSNLNNTVTTLNEQTDCDYIDSYSHFAIHHVMLADKPRTLAYQDAILENRSFFQNKTVLDIGCGVGILSLFAAQAGAKLVVAVDQSSIIYNAKSIIYQNGLDENIKTVKGKLEKIDFRKYSLPEKYDIIISEWMGYFLFFEGMLETVLFARDKLLQNDGILMPNRCKVFLSAFSDCNFYENNIDFWKDVYGFNMSSMINDVTSEATIDLINPENICSTSVKICDFNISNCSKDFIENLSSTFELKFNQDSTIHGFVGWFDCYFESMSKLIILSTSPFSEATHWKQTVFPLKEPILVKSGEILNGTIAIGKNIKNPRAINVTINLIEKNLKFFYNIH